MKVHQPSSKDGVNLIGPSKPSFMETSSTIEEMDTRKPNDIATNVDDDDNNDSDDERTSKEIERRKKKNRRRILLRNEKVLSVVLVTLYFLIQNLLEILPFCLNLSHISGSGENQSSI